MSSSVSVVIPAKNAASELTRCLEGLRTQAIKPNIYVADGKSTDDTVEVAQRYGCHVFTLDTSPTIRRNVASFTTPDEVLAFIDSDCIPDAHWLENGLHYFADHSIGAVVGPNLTRSDTPLKARITGDVLASRFGGGIAYERYRQTHDHFTDERSAILANMLVRRSVFSRIGGFYRWFGGEENDLINRIGEAGFRIVYSRDVVVYHVRVPLFLPYMRQIFLYARGRGLLFRLRGVANPFYLLPTIFALGEIVLLFALPTLGLVLFGLYGMMASVASLQIVTRYKENRTKAFFYLLPAFLLTHVTYALGLLYGFAKPNPGRKRAR
ncbi:MAG: glycosyltransferase [Nitrososphaerota archaeon]|nr:glycosyltransferase [Nitrososphaerota archaeon]